MFIYKKYEKRDLTLPAMSEQNWELMNLIEPVFKKSQYVFVIDLLYLIDNILMDC